MEQKWQYFPYRPGDYVQAIYRRPYSEKKISINDTLKLERLRRDGSWVFDAEDKRLFDEMRSGWFNYQDEISEEEVNKLFAKWQKEGWPDVPKYA